MRAAVITLHMLLLREIGLAALPLLVVLAIVFFVIKPALARAYSNGYLKGWAEGRAALRKKGEH